MSDDSDIDVYEGQCDACGEVKVVATVASIEVNGTNVASVDACAGCLRARADAIEKRRVSG